MASKSDVFDTLKSYNEANKRPIPKRDILAKFGTDGQTYLDALVKEGAIACRRGRNGGYFVSGQPAAPAIEDAPIEAVNAPQSDSDNEFDVSDLAEQFAALEARIAAESLNEESVEA